MSFPRASGVLLHPTSLPGRFGIGDLGPSASEFIDLLASGGQRIWQVLPLGPTGYGDSPYQCFSAFAGNPLLISPELLIEDGWLTSTDVGEQFPASAAVDFPAVIAHRRTLWPRALERFESRGTSATRDRFDRFCTTHAGWLDDYALFTSVKDAHEQRPWTRWTADIAQRNPAAVATWSKRYEREIRTHKLTQFLFFDQWQRIREQCHVNGIEIMGDVPIFVAHDSADVWARPDLFKLDAYGEPTVLTGVPPDYFSATGQLWGNPHYRWETLRGTGFAWWIDRFRSLLGLVDRVRIDHFRGFEASWEVPAGSTTAMRGEWVKGPGAALFDAVERALGRNALPFIAENLGVITPEVEALRQRFGFPGMAILQFAFGTDPQAPTFKPHNYVRNLAVYTGTHDNDTTVGWWTGDVGHSTRTDAEIDEEREHTRRYLGFDDGAEIHWQFIRAVMASVADTAIVPAQDLLGLGNEARLNRPGVPSGNWRWRLTPGQLTGDVLQRLLAIAETYDRVS